MEGESPSFDTIIIGGGPAGLSAAVYAARKSLKVLLIAKNIGGSAAYAGSVENYLGFSVISGAELVAKFREDLEEFKDIQVKEGVEVLGISGSFPEFTIKTGDGEYQSKTVIIASGRVPKMLEIPGEKEYLGKGVAICATCDAPLYKSKDVAVVGGGNSALDAAYALTKIAKSAVIININNELEGDETLLQKIRASPNVKILNNYESIEIVGNQFVTGLKVRDKSSGEEKVLPLQGIFIEIGYTPSTLFDNLTQKNDQGEIVVDEAGATSIPGIWAAGDVNNLWGEQMIISAGEGAKAALAVAKFLAQTAH